MKLDAARFALSSRVGVTSVASIDPETSIVRTIVASSRGTATVADGRARPMTSAANASTYSAGGTWRRQAGDRGTRLASRSTFVKRTVYRDRRRWRRRY